MTTSTRETIMKNILIYLAMALTLQILVSCGGGSGNSDTGNSNQNPPITAKTTAKLAITNTGSLPASTAISGAEFTIILPAGVTPALANGIVESGIVTVSGTFAGSTLAPQVTYTPASTNIPGTLRVILANSATAGIAQVGEMATITLLLANGATPTATSFGVTSANVYDASVYGAISGMGVSVVNVTLQ